MNRFEFFRQLFLAGAAVLAAKVAGAGTRAKAPDLYLDSLYIAGFQYYQGEQHENLLRENELLELRRQTENPHDYFAVEVYHNNIKLGYLPRSGNKIIARMMDQGVRVNARVRSINPEEHPGRRVKVRVYAEK